MVKQLNSLQNTAIAKQVKGIQLAKCAFGNSKAIHKNMKSE